MGPLATLALLSKALYVAVLLLVSVVFVLWMVGHLSSRRAPSSRLHRKCNAHAEAHQLSAHRPTPHYNHRSPTALTPPIDVPPRRLSFSATPRVPTVAPPHRRPAAHRVRFDLTPSQESYERRLRTRDARAAPYSSPGPEVGAFFGEASTNAVEDGFGDGVPRLIELYPTQHRNVVSTRPVVTLLPPPPPPPPLRRTMGSPHAEPHVRQHQRPADFQQQAQERASARPALQARSNGDEDWRRRRQERLATLAAEAAAAESTAHAPVGGREQPVVQTGNENVPPRGTKRVSPMPGVSIAPVSRGGVCGGGVQAWGHAAQTFGERPIMSRFEKRARGLDAGDVYAGAPAAPHGRDELESFLDDDVSPPSIIPVNEGAGPVAPTAAPKRVRFSLEGDEVFSLPADDYSSAEVGAAPRAHRPQTGLQ
jgi:hypothetical protein